MICVGLSDVLPVARSCAHLCHCCTRSVMLLIHHAITFTLHFIMLIDTSDLCYFRGHCTVGFAKVYSGASNLTSHRIVVRALSDILHHCCCITNIGRNVSIKSHVIKAHLRLALRTKFSEIVISALLSPK